MRIFSQTVLLTALATISFGVQAYEVGKPFQGGTIFWVDSHNRHGLIGSITDSNEAFPWSNDYKSTGAFSIGIYGGKANSQRILYYTEPGKTYAALKASYNTSADYRDWYLPDIGELQIMMLSGVISGLDASCYWSSTEGDKHTAYAAHYPSNNINVVRYDKHHECYVRAIRRF